jgi:hypothetical protein
MGSFRIVGTGCQDHLEVTCAPGEKWLLSVDGPLGLISTQDDVAGAVALYNKPQILREFARLDHIQDQLRQYALSATVLQSFFTWLRREISWLLPQAAVPAEVTQQHLERFCRMIFQDPYARDVFDWFHAEYQPVAELSGGKQLQSGLQDAPIRPPQDLLSDLGRAIVTDQPWQAIYRRCLDAMQRQCSTVEDRQAFDRSVGRFQAVVTDFCQYIAQTKPTPDKQRGIMSVLYDALGSPIPPDARFHHALADIFFFTPDRVQLFPPASLLQSFATATMRGIEETRTKLHQTVCSLLNR